MIKEFKAPEQEASRPDFRVFLAGGITDCRNWQKEVVQALKDYEEAYGDLGCIHIFNPRRDDFDVTDPNATVKQIQWEHEHLEKSDIFSVFFAASESLQPITLYELGKHSNVKPSVITVEKGYLREKDVLIQTELDGLNCSHCATEIAARKHAFNIMKMIEKQRR